MDASVIHSPGDLRVESVATPQLEKGQVRVRIRTGGICGSDLHHDQQGGFGAIRIQRPRVLGHAVAGVSATLSYRDAGRAFALAADRSQSMKVILDFE